MKCVNYKQRAKCITLIICLLAGTVMCFLHEPWSDEAQSWNMAKNLDFFGLVSAIRTEGHPILYHLLLKPFTYILPFRFCTFSSLVFGSVGLCFLYKSKLDYRLFIFFCLSPLSWYFSLAFARSYALCLTFFGLIYYLWDLREKCPVILGLVFALSFSVHFMFTAVTGMLAFIFGIEQVKSIVSKFKKHKIMALREIRPELMTGLLLLLGVLVVFNQFMLVDFTTGAGTIDNAFENGGIYRLCSDLTNSTVYIPVSESLSCIIIISFCLFLLVLFAALLTDIISGSYLIISSIAVIVLFARVNLTTPQKVTFLFYVFMFTLMLQKPAKRKINLVCILIICTFTSNYHAFYDSYADFDGSLSFASVIEEYVTHGSKLAILNSASDYSMLTYVQADYDTYILNNADMKAGYIQWSTDTSLDSAIIRYYKQECSLSSTFRDYLLNKGFKPGDTLYISLPNIEIGYPPDVIADDGSATRTLTDEEQAKVHSITADELTSEGFTVLYDWSSSGTLYAIEDFLIKITL